MNCPVCGKEVDANSQICTNCGAQLAAQPAAEVPPVNNLQPAAASPIYPNPDIQTIAPAQATAPVQSTPVASPQLTPEQIGVINSGSWGATLGIFYAAGMGAWGWFAGLLLSSIISPLYLVLWIIFIIKGKSIAWKTRKWQSYEQFATVQKAWDLWGKILLAVQILIIPAIMIAMVLVAVNGARAKARDANVKSDLRSIKSALAQYAVDHNDAYPASLTVLAPKYIKTLPSNPANGQAYGYKKEGAGCLLSSPLENSSDLDLSTDAVPENGTTYDLKCE